METNNKEAHVKGSSQKRKKKRGGGAVLRSKQKKMNVVFLTTSKRFCLRKGLARSLMCIQDRASDWLQMWMAFTRRKMNPAYLVSFLKYNSSN